MAVPEATGVLEAGAGVEAREETEDAVDNWGTATSMAIWALGTSADVASGYLSTRHGHAFQAYYHLLLMHHMPKKPRLLQNLPECLLFIAQP